MARERESARATERHYSSETVSLFYPVGAMLLGKHECYLARLFPGFLMNLLAQGIGAPPMPRREKREPEPRKKEPWLGSSLSQEKAVTRKGAYLAAR